MSVVREVIFDGINASVFSEEKSMIGFEKWKGNSQCLYDNCTLI
jgi:hypothetical protein